MRSTRHFTDKKHLFFNLLSFSLLAGFLYANYSTALNLCLWRGETGLSTTVFRANRFYKTLYIDVVARNHRNIAFFAILDKKVYIFMGWQVKLSWNRLT